VPCLPGQQARLMGRRDPQVRDCASTFVRLIAALAVSYPVWVTPAFSADVSDLPVQLQKKVETAAEACAAFDDGEFGLERGAVRRVDLDGDSHGDWVLNESGFACSTAVSLYCGTGGCMSHFLVADTVRSLLNKGWDVVDLGPRRVVLADVHGSRCGGINPTPCVAASTWDKEGKQWRTTGAEWE